MAYACPSNCNFARKLCYVRSWFIVIDLSILIGKMNEKALGSGINILVQVRSASISILPMNPLNGK